MKYLKYLKYVLEHKWYVFLESCAMGIPIKGIFHDMSKLTKEEFIPYANYFYGDKEDKDEEEFEKAWQIHLKRNPHHPEHWVGKSESMPTPVAKEMVCDLRAMSRKFGGSAEQYYINNYFKWEMTCRTRVKIEQALGLIRSNMTIEEKIEILIHSVDSKDENRRFTIAQNLIEIAMATIMNKDLDFTKMFEEIRKRSK